MKIWPSNAAQMRPGTEGSGATISTGERSFAEPAIAPVGSTIVTNHDPSVEYSNENFLRHSDEGKRSHLGGFGDSGYSGECPPAVPTGEQAAWAEQIEFFITGEEGSGWECGVRDGHRHPSIALEPEHPRLLHWINARHLKRTRQRILHR